MHWRVLLVCLLAPSIHAFSPAPIRWSGVPARSFVLAPRDFKFQQFPNRPTSLPQMLTIWEQPGKMSLNEIPHFTQKSDNSLSWSGLCLEASGDHIGDVVRLNHCTGGTDQLWNLLPSGSQSGHQFQLKGSNNCMDIAIDEDDGRTSLDGALVELRECTHKATESWTFEEFDSLQMSASSQSDAAFRFMRHVTIYMISALGLLSLSAWLWLKRSKPSVSTMGKDKEPFLSSHGGICLVPAVLALNPTETAEPTQPSDARATVLQSTKEVDRGIRASAEDVRKIEEAVQSLESSPDATPLDWANADDVAKLDGRWRLLYSSAIATTRSTGGEYPGAPTEGPVQLGKVLQDIRTGERRLDNCIEPISLNVPAPSFLPKPPTLSAKVRLAHDLELYEKSNVRIKTDGGRIQPGGTEVNLQIPQFLLTAASATFRVSYLDDDVYITRGDRKELRVFVRDDSYDKLVVGP